MFCKFEMDVFGTHVLDLSMYKMLVLEFPLRSPMNKLSKAHRALWVFQLNTRGGSALDPARVGRYMLCYLLPKKNLKLKKTSCSHGDMKYDVCKRGTR